MSNMEVGIKLRTYNHSLETALKAATKKAGMNRVDFCSQVLGFNYSTMSNYLNFKNYPNAQRILDIAVGLEVQPEDIFPVELENVRLEKQSEPVVLPLDVARQLGFGTEIVTALDDDDSLDRIALPAAVTEVLKTLTEREARVIEMRFGLNGEHVSTLGEVGLEFGVTKARIAQIEQKAFRKMRHPVRVRLLGAQSMQDGFCCVTGCVGHLDSYGHLGLVNYEGFVYCPEHLPVKMEKLQSYDD